jgi:CheY-like chemotaxis protein
MASVLVFVVEDEILVRDDLESALERGYAVAVAKSGEEAIAMLDTAGDAFAALVVDVNLGYGKLSGWEVAKHARELKPHLPVIYTTGGNPDQWRSMGVPNSVFIRKPYAIAQVLTAVSELIG